MNTAYKRINIINPTAGQKRAVQKTFSENDEISYITTQIKDAENYVIRELQKEPKIHFYVYGGDGTVNEVVNGIMKSGHNDTARITVVPRGTGNDFYKSRFYEGKLTPVDVIRFNDRYAVNIINCGFDCNVVIKTAEIKKKLPVEGEFAYAMGVANVFFSKFGEHFKIGIEEHDRIIHYEDSYMLCVIANGRFYGGGFEAAPLSEMNDGLLDVLFVKKVSKARFIAMIGDYKKGKHMNRETTDVLDKYKEYMTFKRCRRILLSDMKNLCADGEIYPISEADISVVPGALNFVF